MTNFNEISEEEYDKKVEESKIKAEQLAKKVEETAEYFHNYFFGTNSNDESKDEKIRK